MKHPVFAFAVMALVAATAVSSPAWDARAAAAQPVEPDSLPGAASLFERYVKALGGETAIRDIRSRIIIGSMTLKGTDGPTSQLTTRQIAPDRIIATMQSPGSPLLELGYDGKVAWRRLEGSPAEPVTGDALKQMQRAADIYQEANYTERYKEMQTIGRQAFNSRPAWEVRAVDQDGKVSTLYFDEENALLLGTRQEQISPSGTVLVTMMLSDYKEYGGVQHATRIVQSSAGQDVVITYSDIRVNPPEIEPIEAPPELAARK